jgi:hypothetical protein
MTIFVSIVSYRDPQLIPTIRKAIATALRPDELHFGIVDQDFETLKPPAGRISYIGIDPSYARGPCWARSLAMSLYDGEDWYFQIDSHMHFDQDWDEYLIKQAQSVMSWSDAIVLTSYPNPFVIENGQVVTKPVTREVLAHVVKPGASFSQDHLYLPFEAHPRPGTKPQRGFHIAAGCLFAPGTIVNQFPYDPYFYFQGEEQAYALRLFTHGWRIYHPPGLPIYHLYNTGNTSRPLHWAENDWWHLEQRSRKRLDALVAGEPLGVYGLGYVRTLSDYAVASGIDYQARTLRK